MEEGKREMSELSRKTRELTHPDDHSPFFSAFFLFLSIYLFVSFSFLILVLV